MAEETSRQVDNLLKGTADGSWANWKTTAEKAHGTSVVSCTHSVIDSIDDTSYPRLPQVPSKGDSVSLSFWCRASAPCDVVSYLFDDDKTSTNSVKSVDGGTMARSDGFCKARVGTEWTMVTHTWTYGADADQAPRCIVARLFLLSVGTTVEIAAPMLAFGAPVAWAPAAGELIEGGGTQ